MIIDCISDLHGHYPKLEGGDLLIVAGDLTPTNLPREYVEFGLWLNEQKYIRKILIGGNHDKLLQTAPEIFEGLPDDVLTYLCDSGTEFEGLQVWGSPWIKRFKRMNPSCMAFTLDNESELEEKWNLIPDDTDILITHTPPWRMFDYVEDKGHVGSPTLLEALKRIRPKLHVFGHVHGEHGKTRPLLKEFNLLGYPISVNASYVDENYKPVNKPIRIEL